jgi:hypothetical protein
MCPLDARGGRGLDSVERCRNQLLGSFDIVMTRTNERTNDVMRILTVISAVLLPSVVIAGVMGMNFEAELFDEPAGFYVVLGAMVALAILTLSSPAGAAGSDRSSLPGWTIHLIHGGAATGGRLRRPRPNPARRRGR